MPKIDRNSKRYIVLVLFLSAVTIISACNSFEENSYKTLKSMAVAYNASMEVAYEHYQSMDDPVERDAFWTEVKRYADPVRSSIKAAKSACMAYSRAKAEYDSALEAGGDTSGLLDHVHATKAAAAAALQAVDVQELKDSIETIIGLF